MKPKELAGLLAIGAIVVLCPGSAKAEETAKDKTRMCAGCHGIPDYRIAYPQVYSVPRIGGQDSDYITQALDAYRAGKRKHLSMEGVAASLSDKDIADIAGYYSPEAPQSHGEVDNSGLKKAEASCESCHGKPGTKPAMPGAPKLAGQQYDYLVHSLQAYRSGARDNPIMGAMAKPLTDDDIRALASYYSTIPGLSAKY
jgi:cytochrome c553